MDTKDKEFIAFLALKIIDHITVEIYNSNVNPDYPSSYDSNDNLLTRAKILVQEIKLEDEEEES